MRIPVIDVGPLRNGSSIEAVASAIRLACEDNGFFYISGHGVPVSLTDRLFNLSKEFFGRPLEEKMKIRMELAGKAWRGYFPVGDELTSGKPDQKEGLYFGEELNKKDPAVRAGIPMHGSNLFPDIPSFRETVLTYMDTVRDLGHDLMRGLSLSLGLPEDHFRRHYTNNPFLLFRVFHYPPLKDIQEEDWSVGEHTDYGLLTILLQDDSGGLQVKSRGTWIDAPPIEGTFICNIGDMLDKLTGGRYRSTPHRVRNVSGKGRFSFPFFFDPDFSREIEPLYLPAFDDKDQRWDRTSVHDFKGTYGDYILRKVSRVFPGL